MAYTTIDDPSAHFHTQLYTGNGSSGLAITNDANAGDFKPDWLWIQPRSNGDNSVVWDSSRTVNKRLKTNSDAAEDSDTTALVTFETDGFDLDTTDTNFNGSSRTYVAWQWIANGGSTTTNDASATGVGTIDSVYQANTTAGFSIVSYTGTGSAGTIAHGLGATPSTMIVKNRSKGAGESWLVYHHKNTSAPETDYLLLNSNGATSDNDIAWNDTAPTSTVFSVKDDDSTNDSGETFIAYLFTEIQGYSKFGGYTGNGNADGTFIYTGFKPSFFMWKDASSTGGWGMVDSKRDPYNEGFFQLGPDDTDGDADYAIGDFLSNGVKMRNTFGDTNGSGIEHVYWAFAENPFVTSGGVPCTAR